MIFSQNQNKVRVIEYINMSSLSIYNNYENYYSKTVAKRENGASVGFDINTIHGIKFFERVSISAGMSLDWNINKTFLSTPYIIDLRIFTSRSNQNGFFGYIQTGKNIKWTDSFNGNGVTAKAGVGVIVNRYDNNCFYIELFRKTKEIETEDFKQNGYYNLNSYGMSIGLTFK
ncbi:MAG TPA: hypothetical protein DCM02_06395 [Flavobacterium sp.]|nr:hypothetical protein [Flavobacterium sp.]